MVHFYLASVKKITTNGFSKRHQITPSTMTVCRFIAEDPRAHSHTTCLLVSVVTFISVCASLHKLWPVLYDSEAIFFFAWSNCHNHIRPKLNKTAVQSVGGHGAWERKERSIMRVPLKQTTSSAKLPTIFYQKLQWKCKMFPLGWSRSGWDWLNFI